MGLTLKQVKDDCRWYTNSIQRTFLTNEVLTNAINAARMEWADRVRWPELKSVLPVAVGVSTVDVSALSILDIVAVYYGSLDETCRLHPYDRQGKDIIKSASDVTVVAVAGDNFPAGYFWNMADETFELLSGKGAFAVPDATNIILRFHGLDVLYTINTPDDTVLEIPTQYCWDIKHSVAQYHYQSKDNYAAADKERALWNASLLKAEALFNKSKRDFPKVVKDGLQMARDRYLAGQGQLTKYR